MTKTNMRKKGHDDHGHEEGPTTFANDASEFGLTFNLTNNQKLVINLADEESSVFGAESFMNPVTSDELTFGYFRYRRIWKIQFRCRAQT